MCSKSSKHRQPLPHQCLCACACACAWRRLSSWKIMTNGELCAAWRSEEAQVLKWFWLQSATAEMPGIRHKLNRTVENWQRMEKRHKIGDLKKYWCFDENNDAFFAHEGQGLYHVCFIVYLFFSSLVAVVMTPGSRDAWLYVCERNVCWNSGT